MEKLRSRRFGITRPCCKQQERIYGKYDFYTLIFVMLSLCSLEYALKITGTEIPTDVNMIFVL